MNIFKSKYRKVFSWHIITLYASFLIIGAIHYHHYNLSTVCSYQKKGTENNLAQDLLAGKSGICVINHFSNSILNYHFSSDGIFRFLPEYDQNIFYSSGSFSIEEVCSQVTPRAPPINS